MPVTTAIFTITLEDGSRADFEQCAFDGQELRCIHPRQTNWLEVHDSENECGWEHPKYSEPAMINHTAAVHRHVD